MLYSACVRALPLADMRCLSIAKMNTTLPASLHGLRENARRGDVRAPESERFGYV